MFNSTFLDVAIGLVFLFCLMSLGASTLRETIEAALKTRAIMLEYGMRELLGDATRAPPRKIVLPTPDTRSWRQKLADWRAQRRSAAKLALDSSMTKAMFDHPQINGLFSGEYPAQLTTMWRFWRPILRVGFFSNLPSYIPSRNFAIALLDTVARGPVTQSLATPESLSAINLGTLDIAAIRSGLPLLTNPRLQRALLNVLDEAGTDLNAARQGVERWYDSGMDRVAGWYRRETQAVLFAIGLLLAAVLNIDAVAVGQRLLVDSQWRDSLVQSAAAVDAQNAGAADASTATPRVPSVDALEQVLQKNGFLINAPLRQNWPVHFRWFNCKHDQCVSTNLGGFIEAIPGYLIVALATSLGAAFWFDLLNKLMIVRSTVKPHEKSGEDSSKDNAAPDTPAAAPAPVVAPAVAPAQPSVPIAPPPHDDGAMLLDPNDRPREDYPTQLIAHPAVP
jgi:hypothetical protein